MVDGKSERFMLDTETFETARSVHRVVRAMHDGECPLCHGLFPSEQMRQENGDEVCPNCGFTISYEDQLRAMREFSPVMERNVAVFEQWRRSK